MFASPIVYPSSIIPDKYRLLYAVNPMVGVIEGFRAAMLGTVKYPAEAVLVSFLVSIVLFVAGVTYFKQTERYFADFI